MSPRTVRRVVVAVCLGGIAGMIATSIAGSNAGALTFGLITAAAALSLIVVTAVTAPVDATLGDQQLAEQLERRIDELVAAGADEAAVRALVGDSVRYGRRTGAGGGAG